MSNRRTGFSLRGPARRSFVQFDYYLAHDAPGATVEFALRWSYGDRIYSFLLCQREQIDVAFGRPLQW